MLSEALKAKVKQFLNEFPGLKDDIRSSLGLPAGGDLL